MRKLISILAVGLAVTACSTAAATDSPTAPAGGYNVATGSDQLVLKIESGGGLVPISFTLTQTPQFALYGDGRIIVTGPVDSSYPSPLLPNLRQMTVTPDEIQKIVAAADGAGLLGPDARFDAKNIFDAGTVTFTTTVDGKTHTISAYALGYQGVTAEGVAEKAREKLSAFKGQMANLGAFLGREVAATQTYDAAEMRVFSRVSDSAVAASTTVQVVAWPLSVDPATAGDVIPRQTIRCLLVTGPDLATFMTIARTAKSTTIWTYGASRYSVMVRPLYPNETGCPAA